MSEFDRQEIREKWESFVENYAEENIREAVDRYRDQEFETATGVPIKYEDIQSFDARLAEDLVAYPEMVIGTLNDVIETYEAVPGNEKTDFRAEIAGLSDVGIREVNHTLLTNLVAVEGVVQKVTDPKPRYTNIAFECLRCGTTVNIPQTENEVSKPKKCKGCEREGPFRARKSLSEYVSHQMVRVQEPPEGLEGGDDPRSIDVQVEANLVDEVKPGNKVKVTGILTHPEDPTHDNKKPTVEPYIRANNISVKAETLSLEDISDEEVAEIERIASENPIEAVRDSIAPSIYGCDKEKLALGLQMFSGVRKELDDKTIRGDIHVLLVGDPGTAKSQLLRFVTNTVPRGTYTTGEGSSKAGLTGAAVQDDLGDGGWSIEAGILVLSDKGVAAVDELDKLDEGTDALHSALEQQQVNIAKAGMNTTMNARCGFLAAANPKFGRWDEYETIPSQLELPPALVSRFDLIYTLQDIPDEEEDKALAESVLDTNQAGQKVQAEESLENVDGVNSAPISSDLLSKYIAYARKKVTPVMEDVAKEEIAEFYVELRGEGGDENDAIPVTARKLEAIVRLAEASARVRLSETIEEEDVERAMDVVMHSMNDVGIDPETGEYDVDNVATGMRETQRNRVMSVTDIVDKLEENGDYDRGVPIEEVVEIAEENGFDESKVRKDIGNLKQKGELYEPKTDQVRTT